MATKQEWLTHIEEEWQKFLEIAQGLSDEEQLVQGVVGLWSVKEVLIHIASGDFEVLENMETYQKTGEGKTPSDYPPDVMASLNAEWVDERRGLPLVEVWEYLDHSHRELLQFLAVVPDSACGPDTCIGQWLPVFRDHYRTHREHLEQWKSSRLQ